MIVICDDSGFTSENFENFLWVTFTRSNPAADLNGVGSFTIDKHWGCTGPIVIDARIKPHHAPILEEVASIVKAVSKSDVMSRVTKLRA